MINIKGGPLWQWSIGRQVIITAKEGHTISKVEFSNGIIDYAIKGEIEMDKDGNIVSTIPPQLLQYASALTVYAVSASEDMTLLQTTEAVTFVVNGRERPEDYVYTNEEIHIWEEHAKQIASLEQEQSEMKEEIEDAREGYDVSTTKVTESKKTLFKTLGEAIRTQIRMISAYKVSLPVNSSNEPINGTEGQLALSNGKGGIKFSDLSNAGVIDKTLSQSGLAADAYVTGEKIESALQKIEELEVSGTSYIVTSLDITNMGEFTDTSNVSIGSFAAAQLFGDTNWKYDDNYFIHYQRVYKGDILKMNQGWMPPIDSNVSDDQLIFAGISGNVIDTFPMDDLREAGSYTFTEEGIFYICALKKGLGSDSRLFEIHRNTFEQRILDNVQTLTEDFSKDIEAVSESVENITESVENITESVENITESVENITESVKETIEDIEDVSNIVNEEYELIPVTLDDIKKSNMDKYFYVINSGSYTDPKIGSVTTITTITVDKTGHCIYEAEVKKGDCLIFTNAHDLTSSTSFIVFSWDVAGIPVKASTTVYFSKIKNAVGMKYTFLEDGVFRICFDYTTIQSGEFFYIKRTHRKEPYVLYAEKAESYVDDADTGEAVMKAIMEGRQIVIRVPNADGGKYMALYSPVLMYQLPNYLARHLYLFYLNDGVDAMGLPSYSQLKIAVSRDYNQTPLS